MKAKLKKFGILAVELAINLVIIIGLVIVIHTWIIKPFNVSGASMCDTLNKINEQCVHDEGEKIIINAATYLWNEPKRGDIIVFQVKDNSQDSIWKKIKDTIPFQQANEKKFYIKRIIGQPGDTVELQNGEVFINSRKIEEDYLNTINKGHTEIIYKELKEFKVPEGQYFVMGDNRNESTDSRSCFGQSIGDQECAKNPEKAFIKKSQIKGKASLVWWPPKNTRLLKSYDYGI